MLTPEEVRSRAFLVSLRGYDRDEVHAFLATAADDLETLQERLLALNEELDAARSAPVPSAAEESVAPAGLFAEIGTQTQRILEAAQQAGDELRRAAEAEADDLRRGAQQEANRERTDVRAETTRMIADAERQVETIQESMAELEQARETLAEQLRSVGRTVERTLRDLLPDAAAPAISVREALTSSASTAAAPAMDDEVRAAVAVAEPEVAVERPADAGEPESAPERRPPDPMAQPPVDDPLDRRADALGPLHPRLVRALKRRLRPVQADLAKRIDAGEDRVRPSASALEGLGETADPLLVAAHRAGLEAGARLAGAEPVDVSAVSAPAGLGAELAAVFAEHLQAAADGAQSAGSGTEPAGARLDTAVEQLSQTTLPELGALALLQCYERGLADAWRAAGVTHRKWLHAAEPECPDPRCADNARHGPVPMDEPFPSGHDAPPVRVGCACSTLPERAAVAGSGG